MEAGGSICKLGSQGGCFPVLLKFQHMYTWQPPWTLHLNVYKAMECPRGPSLPLQPQKQSPPFLNFSAKVGRTAQTYSLPHYSILIFCAILSSSWKLGCQALRESDEGGLQLSSPYQLSGLTARLWKIWVANVLFSPQDLCSISIMNSTPTPTNSSP